MKQKATSWNNVKNWAKGKERLKNAILQHPEEENSEKSIFNYVKGKVEKRKSSHILPFKNYEKMGKTNEDMLSPMDSPTASNNAPGQFHQTPMSIPTQMDQLALLGPMNKPETKKKKSSKKDKKDEPEFKSGKVLTFTDFIESRKQ